MIVVSWFLMFLFGGAIVVIGTFFIVYLACCEFVRRYIKRPKRKVRKQILNLLEEGSQTGPDLMNRVMHHFAEEVSASEVRHAIDWMADYGWIQRKADSQQSISADPKFSSYLVNRDRIM